MKNVAFIILLLFMILILPGCTSKKTTPQNKSRIILDVTAVEAKQLVERNKDNPSFMILDVRTKKEFDEERIEKSFMIDYYSPDFREKLDKLDKERTYLVYCRTGRRSKETLEIMEELGFKNAYNMEGGITKWKQKRFPTI